MHAHLPITLPPLPDYQALRTEDVGPAIQAVLTRNLDALSRILIEQQSSPTWDGLVKPLEDLDQQLLAILQPLLTLAGERGHSELAKAYRQSKARVVLYKTALQQNATLYGLLQQLQEGDEALHWSAEQRQAVKVLLRDAQLAGVGYGRRVRNRCVQLQLELEDHYAEFDLNLQAGYWLWFKDFALETELDGLGVAHKLALAERAAADGAAASWRLTLDSSSVQDVLAHAHDRALRQEVYLAFYTLASEQNPLTVGYDNGPIIERILAKRLALANLLGHPCYAQRAMATRMFDTPEDVQAFLQALLAKVQPAARRELQRLEAFARDCGAADFQPWDVDYYKERYRQAHFGVVEQAVRDYFPIPAVLRGLGAMVRQLFGVSLRECPGASVWHADVRLYELHDASGVLGYLYFDLYTRPGKGPGVWMEGLRDRHRYGDGQLQLPIARLNCDFSKVSIHSGLNMVQLTNLLHEFGHALHHVLTRVEHGSIAGINGVAEDAVEFPSRLFEAWPQAPASVALLSAHCQTGEAMPEELLANVLASRKAFQALELLYQLEYALVDLRLHMQVDSPQVMPVVHDVLAEVEILATPRSLRYTHSFMHLFASHDYASGYYTYVWSQVLAAETFARFEQEGVLSPAVGARLRELILAPGGTLPLVELLEQFSGHPPGIDALLASMDL